MKNRFVLLVVLAVLLALTGSLISAQDMEYNESPMLAEMVAAGDLPPVAERLPVEPQVTAPAIEVGQYGGEMRMGFTGGSPFWGGMWYVTGWEMLVGWKQDFSGVEANIVRDWEVSEDVTEYTFYLREGMKWSDGMPFTSEDVRFYIEDNMMNPEISPSGPVADWLPQEAVEGLAIEVIDDYTFTIKFGAPNGLFLLQLAQWSGREFAAFPAHFMKQFHADYNENVDEIVAAQDGVEDWLGLFNYWKNIEQYFVFPQDNVADMLEYKVKPYVGPWRLTQELGTGTQIRFERNPYYFKVDTEGNQLPYIDTLVGLQYQDGESRTLAMLNGDLDYYKDPSDGDRIVYIDAMDEGRPLGMTFPVNDAANTQSIMFNINTPDPVLAEIFADKNFRIGMSHAINRAEVVEIVHFGQGEPAQLCPHTTSPLSVEGCLDQYVEYDVDLANEYLDRVAPEKNGSGTRLGPDGEPISFVLSVPNTEGWQANWPQVGELLTNYFKAVGFDVLLNVMSNDQFSDDRDQNLIEASIFTAEGGAGLNAILDPRYFVPGELYGMFVNGYHAWRTNAVDSTQVEMTPEMQEWRAQYEAVLALPSQDDQIEAMKTVIQRAMDEFYVIGISTPAPIYQIFSDRMGNMPDGWVKGWIEGVEKITRPEQWYIKS